MKYDVLITEISTKHVTIEADSSDEAEEIARDNWNASDPEYILTSDDFDDVEFTAKKLAEENTEVTKNG